MQSTPAYRSAPAESLHRCVGFLILAIQNLERAVGSDVVDIRPLDDQTAFAVLGAMVMPALDKALTFPWSTVPFDVTSSAAADVACTTQALTAIANSVPTAR